MAESPDNPTWIGFPDPSSPYQGEDTGGVVGHSELAQVLKKLTLTDLKPVTILHNLFAGSDLY